MNAPEQEVELVEFEDDVSLPGDPGSPHALELVAPDPEEAAMIEGLHDPRHHTTIVEMVERIEFTIAMLDRDLPKHVIKKELKKKYGIAHTTCERYLRRAREMQVKWSGRSKQDHFTDSACFWRSYLQAPNSDSGTKMFARQQLDRLYGLHRHSEEGAGEETKPIGVVRFLRSTTTTTTTTETESVEVTQQGNQSNDSGGK